MVAAQQQLADLPGGHIRSAGVHNPRLPAGSGNTHGTQLVHPVRAEVEAARTARLRQSVADLAVQLREGRLDPPDHGGRDGLGAIWSIRQAARS